MKVLIFSTILEGFKTRRDNTIAITFSTPELTPDLYGNIMSCLNKHCEMMLKEGEINEDDLTEFKNTQFDEFDKRNDKTPSQRQRNVLYILWEQDKKGYEVFKDFYDHHMEKIIDHLKTKIIDK